MVPPCRECERSGVVCMKKTRGPGCQRCAGRKIRCSTVEEQRKKKKGTEGEKETEKEKEKVIRVRRPKKKEDLENGEEGKMGVLRRIAEALEGMLAGQQEMIDRLGEIAEEQQGIRLGMEVWMRRDEERERKRENGKGKGKEKEKEKESDEEMEKSDEEKDGDGEENGEEEENGKDDGDGGDEDRMDDEPTTTSAP